MTATPDIPSVSALHPVLASQSRISKSMGNMALSNGRVRIKFAQPEDHKHAGQQHVDSIAAERQCRAYMAVNQSQCFGVKVDGDLPSPGIEVAFQRSLLDKLPLLNDVQSSTDASKSSRIELPCSVWGLVSLLILLEGEAGVGGWFRGKETDAALPASTLLAADFMGCSQVKEDIITWLRSILQYVLATPQRDDQACQDQRRQYTRVLSIISSEFTKAVFSEITAAQAVCLPLLLFSQWVSSLASRCHTLMQVPFPFDVNCYCGMTSCIRKQIVQDSAVVLASAQAMVGHTTNLQVLGLHNIHLAGAVLSGLESLLENLPPTLVQLHITTQNFEPVSVQMKERFFRAVAQVHTLQELHMPHWQAFVGADARLCIDPLMGVPGLRIVVPSVGNGVVFPPELSFTAKQ